MHVVTYLLINSAVNAVGHRFGKRPYPGIATNNQWLAYLTWGEGLHSNHHAAAHFGPVRPGPPSVGPGLVGHNHAQGAPSA